MAGSPDPFVWHRLRKELKRIEAEYSRQMMAVLYTKHRSHLRAKIDDFIKRLER